ncbi:UxaA family hydrolase [Dyadobacter sp. CY327]|uniref:UxaA family hydrolase n=1 Tax=Dyadobacter sp. CY327 TaxID=2907301 RepID=UPI001F47F770|nr:UxaA family hydrolase [Dyadobacter sp. CY327]MCE7070837.1 UxaA family hydrolase [Dyadobacter sp. CY327]
MNLSNHKPITGFLREDGRKGIRNLVLVVYLVECAHHVARKVTSRFEDEPVHLIGFSGCYPNGYADKMMNALCTHPNVGAVLLVSLGCESFNRNRLYEQIASSGRPVRLIGIQNAGGTENSVQEGISFIASALETIKEVPRVPFSVEELIVGIVSGGSDATSGITANPASGLAFDMLNAAGSTTIFENTSEMIGLENLLGKRARHPELISELQDAVAKAARYHAIMGHGSFAPGNAEGGLTTLEEKSMGAYCKSGTAPIRGLIKPGDLTTMPGLYLMDIVPDGEPRFGFPNPNDISEMNELIASGAHCVLFTTGRGSVAGSAVSPVIKICANPETFARMEEDMDVNAGKILTNEASPQEVAQEIFDKILYVAAGGKSCSEQLGHQEFSLGYKSFEPIGPSCLPY